MPTVRRLIVDLILFALVLGVVIFLYGRFSDQIFTYLFGEQHQAIAVDDVSLIVTYADTVEEREQGLSGVDQLDDREGKLFFFDQEDYYGFWMKDMLIPIDIIWINNNLEVVHIEENVAPDSFPAVYYPIEPARFVLEVNAFFADTFKIELGDRLDVPISDLPADLQANLQ